MPIKNYTTKVSPERTADEVSRIIARFGARRIERQYDDDGNLVSLAFSILVAEREVGYRVPVNPENVLRTLERDGAEPRYRTLEHARRVSWRIAKDWIDAQLAVVEAGNATAPEVLLPYMITRTGETLSERALAPGALDRLLLTSGTGP